MRTMKTCNTCEETKPLARFVENRRKCRDCRASEQRKREGRSHWLKWRYGIDEAQYNEMLEAQNDACMICGCKSADSIRGVLCVDHCHDTGAVRGLLCWHCNSGLGQFRDNIEVMEKAITYIKENK